LTYAQHIFPGGPKILQGDPGYGPEHMSEEQSTESHLKH